MDTNNDFEESYERDKILKIESDCRQESRYDYEERFAGNFSSRAEIRKIINKLMKKDIQWKLQK
jgi:hypothetical protein